jgi:hypothetical protein
MVKICCLRAGYVGEPKMAIIPLKCPFIEVVIVDISSTSTVIEVVVVDISSARIVA